MLAATSRFGTNARSLRGEVAIVNSASPQHTRKDEGVWDPKKVYPNLQVMASRQQLWRGLATEGETAPPSPLHPGIKLPVSNQDSLPGFRGGT